MRSWSFAFAAIISAAALAASCSSALAAGALSGTATASGSGAPVSGLSVCAEENFLGGVNSGCTKTDPGGHYAIGGLPPGSNYQVEFSAVFPQSPLNFLTQYWQGKESLGNWDPVTVKDGLTTEGIDAVMNPGAEIAGHLAEAGTGADLVGVQVCILDPAPTPRAEEFERCATSDASGNYVVRSLRAGTFIVAFAHYRPLNPPGPIAEQYYAGASDKAAATQITIAPPESRTGIDATLVNRLKTTIRRMPKFSLHTPSRKARVGFRFSAPPEFTELRFTCRKDGGPWRFCRSPLTYTASVGRHTLRVRALMTDGVSGAIASLRFRVTSAKSKSPR